MFKIHLEAPGQKTHTFLSPQDLEEGMTFVVGRHDACDIVLKHDHISSEHGEFVHHRGTLFYRDRRSTNGSVLVRGEEENPLGEEFGWAVQLDDGDRLLLGGTNNAVALRLELRTGPPPELTQTSDDFEEELAVLAVSHMTSVHELEGRLGQDPLWMSKLYKASKRMGASLELRAVVESACSAILELLPTATNISFLLDQRTPSPGLSSPRARDLVSFWSVDREGNQVTGERPSRQVISRVMAQNVAVVICDTGDIAPSQSIIRAKISSVMGVPLMVGERIVGLVQVDNRSSQGVFNQNDLECVVVLAQQIALALENARLFQRVKLAEQRLQGENTFLKRKEGREFENIIGESPSMKKVFNLVDRVVDTSATVLVTGETGTGKELIARAIHQRSGRADKLFVAQNCSALPESLLESELFGHRRGAFTGADSDKKGLFELAHGGTIFLDEIGETTGALQAKLLRVLQESEIRPVGAMYPKRIDVRVIAATNRNLEKEVEEGRFREDLYYRLNVFPIHLPPLRERREDIPLLAEYYLEKFCRAFNRPLLTLGPESLSALQTYRWPGNIRELQNEVQRVVIHGVTGDLILPENLAPRFTQASSIVRRINPAKGGLKKMMEEVERWILTETLREHDNNKTQAAATLKITREGLHKKLSRYGL